jgi:hypothetical protein
MTLRSDHIRRRARQRTEQWRSDESNEDQSASDKDDIEQDDEEMHEPVSDADQAQTGKGEEKLARGARTKAKVSIRIQSQGSVLKVFLR